MENSPLAKLAPELRNRIYEFAVSESEPIHVHRCDPYLKPWFKVSSPPNGTPPQRFAPSAICKQIRAECTQCMFFNNNDFRFWHRLSVLDRFLATIGELNSHDIRSVTIDVNGSWSSSEWGVASGVKSEGRDKMQPLRQRAKQYGWLEAKVILHFFWSDASCQVSFDVLNLGEPWDELDASLDVHAQQAATACRTDVMHGMRAGAQWCRDLLRGI